MKTLRFALLVLPALLVATAAQAQQTKIVATVPFDFVVGNHVYPAGEYSVKALSQYAGIMRIEEAQQTEAASVLSIACTSLTPSTETKLVFRRMGDNKYALYQTWIAGQNWGREFQNNRSEARFAQNHEKPELVIVAANIAR
ncbi:MAG: hypothetical protein WBR26_12410 [Candidatus Acidiferrum sp.]